MHSVECLHRGSFSSAASRRVRFRFIRLGVLAGLFIAGLHVEAPAGVARQKSAVSWDRSGMVRGNVMNSGSRADSLPDGTSAPEPSDNGDEDPTWSRTDLQRYLVYPDSALRNNIQGEVMVRVLLDKKGHVVRMVADSGAHQLLVDAALEAVGKLSFTPAKVRHTPVSLWVWIPVRFRLYGMAPKEDARPLEP